MTSSNVYCIEPLAQGSSSALSQIAWDNISALDVASVHPRSSSHTPKTSVRVAYDSDALYLKFQVEDQYVCCRHLEHQSQVCEDSCVEAFLKPVANKGYFNFEINVSGVMLVYYVADNTPTPDGFKDHTILSEAQLQQIQILSDHQRAIDPEISEPLSWSIICRIPRTVFEDYLGPLTLGPDSPWQGNFYKCADQSSHPHWMSWNPVGEVLNFHKPECFGQLQFS
ncbi:MAG: carbohydrate-binding family 9-like protein [Phycisphaeraceae bacterium]|nr:carbohydrate-binding family 9-like protein [Phycisphaeraceae bacterium]